MEAAASDANAPRAAARAAHLRDVQHAVLLNLHFELVRALGDLLACERAREGA